MLIQIHLLQNYAPANLNRDDTGAPKDAMFGGYRRGRISSQCLKRSIRRSEVFKVAFEDDNLLGTRTRLLSDLIRQELEKINLPERDAQLILSRVSEIGRESKKKKEESDEESTDTVDETAQTKQLIFIAPNEIKPLAEKLCKIYRKLGSAEWKKVKIQDIVKELGSSLPLSVDIAMFGRMTTSGAFEDVQAAVQVAHALSTNSLAQEFDYFTAVDDLSGESGAGMIGDVEFNSSTYYKYFSVHWEQLVQNLGKDQAVARKAVLALVKAAATAQPSGKQNSFAANNLPDLVLVEVSQRNLPISYVNAFLKPVKPEGGKSQMQVSIERLNEYVSVINRKYGIQAARAAMTTDDSRLDLAKPMESLSDLCEWLGEQLPEG